MYHLPKYLVYENSREQNGSFSLLIVASSLIDVGILAGIQRECNGTLGNGKTRGSKYEDLDMHLIRERDLHHRAKLAIYNRSC